MCRTGAFPSTKELAGLWYTEAKVERLPISSTRGGGGEPGTAREDQGVEHSQSIPHLYLYKPHAQTWHAPMFVCLVLSRLMTHPCHFQNWWSPFMGHMFPEYVGLTPCLATRPTSTTHSQLTKPCTASFAENTHTQITHYSIWRWASCP